VGSAGGDQPGGQDEQGRRDEHGTCPRDDGAR
jgi:hypothetical protein